MTRKELNRASARHHAAALPGDSARFTGSLDLKTRLGLILPLIVIFIASCTNTSHVALLSRGGLEGKELTSAATGQILEGRECGLGHNLSTAFDDAVKGTSYDTLTDVDVTSTTGIFSWSNCIEVKGHAARSADLPQGQVK